MVTLVVETLEPLEIKNGLLMLLLLVDGESISPAMGYTLGSTNQPSPFDSRAFDLQRKLPPHTIVSLASSPGNYVNVVICKLFAVNVPAPAKSHSGFLFRLEPVLQFGRAGKVERGLRLGQVFSANHSSRLSPITSHPCSPPHASFLIVHRPVCGTTRHLRCFQKVLRAV